MWQHGGPERSIVTQTRDNNVAAIRRGIVLNELDSGRSDGESFPSESNDIRFAGPRCERMYLLFKVIHLHDASQHSLGHGPSAARRWQRSDGLPDRGSESQETKNLGYSGTCDTFATGDSCLTWQLAGVELATPFGGFSERLDDRGRTRQFGLRLFAPLAAGCGNRRYDLVIRDCSRQHAHTIGSKGRGRPQANVDGLLAVTRRRRGVRSHWVALDDDVNDPEDNLGFVPPGVGKTAQGARQGGSNTVTLGEIEAQGKTPRAFFVRERRATNGVT